MLRRGEEWAQYDKAVTWVVFTFLIALVSAFILSIFIFPLSYLVGYGLSAENFEYVGRYLALLVENPGHLFTTYGKWFRQYWEYKGET